MSDHVHWHLYLSEDDVDIALLHKAGQLKNAVRQAICKYLTGDSVEIPLPPYQDIPAEKRRVSLYFDTEIDEDIIEFIKKLPPGNASLIMRMLIRNAMRRADIRYWMGEKRKKARRPNAPKKEKKKTKIPVPQTSPAPDYDMDDIFDGI